MQRVQPVVGCQRALRTGRYRQPQWECFARYVLPKGKVEGDGANMRIELPIPEKAGKKAVLIGRGQWEV